MGKKHRRLSRGQRDEMKKAWGDTVFPAALLLFGPPPFSHDYDDIRYYRDEKRYYMSSIHKWYFDNYLSMHSKPPKIIIRFGNEFVWDYEQWIDARMTPDQRV